MQQAFRISEHDRSAPAARFSQSDLDLVYVHPVPIPGPAANTVQVAKMCDAFARSGVATKLVQPQAASGAQIASYYGLASDPRVVSGLAPKLPGRMLLFGLDACLRHASRRTSVIYTRSISVAFAATKLGYRVALEMHGPLWDDKSKDRERFDRIIRTPAFTTLVVISQKIADWYLETYPDLDGRIIVAHDGADPVTTEVTPRPLAGSFRVGYTGHLYPGKGMELISAIAPLCPEATFHVVGGLPEDISRWQRELAEAGTGDNIVFHGHQPHTEIAGFIEAMDVVLAPYLRFVRGQGGETRNLSDWMSPLKLFEYMAHGKAILCSDLPVLREVLSDGRNARLADPDRPEDWAALLRESAADPTARDNLGRQARADFLDHYSWDKRAETILEGILQMPAPARHRP